MEPNFIGYKIKLYPTKEQEAIFNEYFGATRFVYNLAIDINEENFESYKEKEENGTLTDEDYKSLKPYTLSTKFTKLIKTDPHLGWLQNYDHTSLCKSVMVAGLAFKKFFDRMSSYPKRKKKRYSSQTFYVREDRLSVYSNSVRIPSIGEIHTDSNPYNLIGSGDKYAKRMRYVHYANSVVKFDGCNYYLSFQIKEDDKHISSSAKKFKYNEFWRRRSYSEGIGIDLGCKRENWIVDSAGNRIVRPDSTKVHKKIDKLMKKFMRQYRTNNKLRLKNGDESQVDHANFCEREYSNGEKKTLYRLNKAFHHITNRKKDVIYNYANELLKLKPEFVVMEDIKVENILKNGNKFDRKNRKRFFNMVNDSELYIVKETITRVMENNGIEVVIADKEYPSTQICCKCGCTKKVGSTRTYRCENPACGEVIDRDLNAAINLSKYKVNSLKNKKVS